MRRGLLRFGRKNLAQEISLGGISDKVRVPQAIVIIYTQHSNHVGRLDYELDRLGRLFSFQAT